MATAVTRLQPERALEAAGYIRVSRKVQAEGHSPEIQREAIKRLARQEGYILTDEMIKEDHERGSKVTRKGYQDIIAAVREGTIHAVLVFMFDRWGRDGAEWLARAHVVALWALIGRMMARPTTSAHDAKRARRVQHAATLHREPMRPC